MDDPDLTKLIDYIIACNASLKGAADQYLAALQGMKATSLRCDADLRAKKARAGEEADQLRAEIQQLNGELQRLERILSTLKDRIEAEKKNIGREKQKTLKQLDEWLAAQPRA
jgi:predicted  nucleic acid-binding Zn-ribbon protein